MIYTHVLNKGGQGVRSPLDFGEPNASPVLRDVSSDYVAVAIRPPRSTGARRSSVLTRGRVLSGDDFVRSNTRS